jgi:hypothetical protein
MPDYLTARSWVEVQGCGRDQVFKFKQEKLAALVEWERSTEHPVEIFLWNKTAHQCIQVPLETIIMLAAQDGALTGMFDETKPWVGLEPHQFDGWRDVPRTN